jgi:hypothetical protein
MAEEKWALGTAGATVRLEGDVGVVAVRGLVCNRVLETLHGRIGTWAALRRPVGYALVLGWESVLTASGPRELMACMRGTSKLAETMPAAIVVPPERMHWATKHCLQIAEHGLCRAAFVEQERAIDWLRRVAPAFAHRQSATPLPAIAARRGGRPSAACRLSPPATPRSLGPASGLGSLGL